MRDSCVMEGVFCTDRSLMGCAAGVSGDALRTGVVARFGMSLGLDAPCCSFGLEHEELVEAIPQRDSAYRLDAGAVACLRLPVYGGMQEKTPRCMKGMTQVHETSSTSSLHGVGHQVRGSARSTC